MTIGLGTFCLATEYARHSSSAVVSHNTEILYHTYMHVRM